MVKKIQWLISFYKGALRNKDGSVRKRWSDKTSKAFESVKNCFVESFNNLHLFERSVCSLNFYLDGKQKI